jgi:urea carboxylase
MIQYINVLKPGVQSQLQDLGRFGFQDLGVPVCGAMDEWSHRLANLLAGNARDEATLEIVLMGPSLVFEATTQIAITGADLSPRFRVAPCAKATCSASPVHPQRHQPLRLRSPATCHRTTSRP